MYIFLHDVVEKVVQKLYKNFHGYEKPSPKQRSGTVFLWIVWKKFQVLSVTEMPRRASHASFVHNAGAPSLYSFTTFL